MAFFEPYKEGYLIRIKLYPNASFCGANGLICDADGVEYLKVCVNAVPEKGKANKKLTDWLSKRLKVSKQGVSIISGATDHMKKLYIETRNINIITQLNELVKE